MSMKDTLARYLSSQREALLWKATGLSEYDLRRPLTPTGTNLLGLVKHCALVEHGYLVESMGRTSRLALPRVDFDADPNGDFVACPDETAESLIALYRAVGDEVERSVVSLDLDAPGHVEWWGDSGDTTFGRLLVHVLAEVARHAGHADILREAVDGAAGLTDGNTNLWEPEGGWEAHVARVTELAEGARHD
ncbi:DinB family protein [Tessaracoccus oleiagri]|uniref:DinB superfamily protein n=1 Tax=Tessaracoccus oleiagri TaxID=686624 RepID=A0A1G9LLX4_9ACTN|nr:DinB family protein [Tessaracoccus oleiagri]SDL62898.1 Protein of unknown function [Tessaracoccus oleiagri]